MNFFGAQMLHFRKFVQKQALMLLRNVTVYAVGRSKDKAFRMV